MFLPTDYENVTTEYFWEDSVLFVKLQGLVLAEFRLFGDNYDSIHAVIQPKCLSENEAKQN